jgi:hypothetical protein
MAMSTRVLSQDADRLSDSAGAEMPLDLDLPPVIRGEVQNSEV